MMTIALQPTGAVEDVPALVIGLLESNLYGRRNDRVVKSAGAVASPQRQNPAKAPAGLFAKTLVDQRLDDVRASVQRATE
jgi:hypothetical protein